MGVTTQFDMVGGSTRYGMFEDFVGKWTGSIAGVATGVTENSGTAAIHAGQEDGQVNLITGTSSGNRSMLIFDTNYKASTGGGLVMEAGVNLAALTSVEAFVGFTDLATINVGAYIDSGTTITLDATADAVGFMFSTAATNTANWYVGGVKNSAATAATLTSGFPLVASTFQALRVQVDTNGTAYFFINGNQVGVTNLSTSTGQSGLVNAVTASALLTPIVAVKTKTTAAKTMNVDYMYCQKARTN